MNSRAHSAVPADILELFEGVPETAEVIAKMKANEVDLDADPEFVAGYLKAQFVEDICHAMAVQSLNRNQLARKLGKSRQYVGRVLNENANFTLETLAEIACALGMQVTARMYSRAEHIEIVEADSKPAAGKEKLGACGARRKPSGGRKRIEAPERRVATHA